MSLKKLIDLDLLSRTINKIKVLIPNAATATPKMDGTAAVGTSSKYAKEDHVHPSDTGKVSKTGDNMSGTLTLAGNKYYDQNSVSALNLNNSDIIGINGMYMNDASEDGREGINFARDSTHWDSLYALNGKMYFSPYREKGHAQGIEGRQELYCLPAYGTGTTDISIRPLIAFSRANRLAFLPPDQVIVEKTTDGGETWVDAGYSDYQKKAFFATRGASFQIPLLNGEKSTQCGLRITFSAMKYNVPSGTEETEKYDYWSSAYVDKQERYSNIRELWFWLSSNNDSIRVQVYRATGANPNTWVTEFDTNFALKGWSGSDWVRCVGATFGGGTNQTGNYWNWRVVFWSRMNDNETAFQSTSVQVVNGMAGYGDSVWGAPNGMMKEDHLYTWDVDQNATFPANITASKFIGPLQGNADTATNAAKVNNHTVEADVPSGAKFTDTTELGSMTGTLGVDHGGTGKTNAADAANVFVNALTTESSTPADADYYVSQYVGGGTTTTTYHRRPMSALWEYIKGKISSVLGLTDSLYGGAANKTLSVPIATVDSTSTSTAFTVQVPEFENETGPRDGLFFYVYNNKVTSASGYTINVNGWGAKPVYNAQCERTTTGFSINRMFPIWYNSTLVEGGCWIIGYLSDANTNTIGYQLRMNSTVMKTSDQSRYYRLFFTSADRTHWVPANTAKDNSATSAKTVNQRPIDPFGRIIYFGATTNLSAESDVSASYCWDQYAFSLGYSFNMTGVALTLTTKTPVYIKCAPQSDGSAIIDSTTPYVQSLPSSEDGKIYIFLGVAYSATNVELMQHHPIYCYEDGAIRLWTNQNTNAKKVNGYTVASNVPANAVFTDTTYESKTAASGGTDLSLVTTGEKYNWNARGIPASGTTGQVLKKSSNSDYATEWADESGGALHVTVTYSGGNYVFDKTNAEIYNAHLNGSYVFLTNGAAIFELQYVSQTEARFVQMDVTDLAASKRVFNLINGSVRATNTTFQKTVPAKFQLVNDGSYDYQDSPTGPFSVAQSDIADMYDVPGAVSGELGQGAILLSFGSPYTESSATAVAEYYNLVSVAYEPSDPAVVTLTFRTISMRSGSPITKTVTISDCVDKYDYMQSATVTYSESSLGAPPSASGVGF